MVCCKPQFRRQYSSAIFGTYHAQVVLAATGFAIYGVGCEIAGITVSKVIVKWFTGHELALAMGLQVALARIGTAGALAYALPFAKTMGGVSASVGLGAALLCAGMIAFIVYCVMDRKKMHLQPRSRQNPKKDSNFQTYPLSLATSASGMLPYSALCFMPVYSHS